MAVTRSRSLELRGLAATQRLAGSVAAVLRPGDVIGLDGDLGAGKTTFVRYLARALGVTTPVTSPTFTLANTYETSRQPPPPPAGPPLLIHHIDAYRLDGDADAEDLALPELLDSGGILVVEWAERLTLPTDRLDIHFAYPPEPHPVSSNSPAAATSSAPAATAPGSTADPAADPADPAADPADPGTEPPDSGTEPPDSGTEPPDTEPPDTTDHRIATVTPQGPNWQTRPLTLD